MAASKSKAVGAKTMPAKAVRSKVNEPPAAAKASVSDGGGLKAPASAASPAAVASATPRKTSTSAAAAAPSAPPTPSVPSTPKPVRKKSSSANAPAVKTTAAKPAKTAAAKRKPRATAAPVQANEAADVVPGLAVAAAGEHLVAPVRPGVTVFQIYFEPAQRAELDPAFVPYDNAGSRDPLLEFAVFERLARDEGVQLAPLWGAVSWRFGRKTGLTGKAWLDEMAAHPGFDLYFCNPEPENEGLYANQWHRGITAHPGFRELSAAVLRAAGHDPAHLDAVAPPAITSSCNYFVGNAAFWSAYLPFVRGIVDAARRSLPADVLAALDSARGDPRGLHGGASYWPFIVERLLPLFLRGPGQSLKVHKVPLVAAEGRLNAHVKRLREMKDVAHRTRSLWLHSCWVHYRNLFLLQAAGKEWCKENLVKVTPREVVFL